MKAFVTGATGFIGSAIVRALLARGYEVVVLVRKGANRGNLAGLDLDVIEGDLTDSRSLEAGVSSADCVIHAAADYRLWVPDPAPMFATNVSATATLMRLCLEHHVSRVIYTSSVSVLGLCPDGTPADEDVAARAEDMVGHYKRSKFEAEQVVRELVTEQGLPAVVLYPTAPVGPRDIKPTPTGRTILDAARGRMPAYVDTGLNIVHVDDVAEGHMLALEKAEPGTRYILGAENMTLAEILTEVAGIVGRPAPWLRLPHQAILPVAYVAEAWARLTGGETRITVDAIRMAHKMMFFSSERAGRELGYSPRPAHEAIVDAVAWFEEQGYCE